MITLIKNGELYTPKYAGRQSILLVYDKIAKIGEINEEALHGLGVELRIINATDCIVTPGFIDPHVHLTGGGGEGGFATRTPEIQLSDIISAGVTTVVGCLGTDGTTRHMTSLLAKARGLEEEGITTYIYTGNYHVPTPTITSSVKNDVILIDKIVGAGEIAISDSRSAQPSLHELAKLVAEARIGGLLSGKAGVTHFHVGPGKQRLQMLHTLLEEYEIPPSKLYPTHIMRSKELMDDAIALSQKGGFVDLTTVDNTGEWIQYYKKNGGVLTQLTLSSDGNGSFPKFDADGRLMSLEVVKISVLYEQVVTSVLEYQLPLEEVLPLVTSNTADVLCLRQKGRLQEQLDADVLILNKESLNIVHLFAKGRRMVENGIPMVKGTFEDNK